MRLKIRHIEKDFPIDDLDNEGWSKSEEISIEKYWSGKSADVGRRAKAMLLWSDSALYVRFEANQTEPLIINKNPNLQTKTIGLWNRDVCEIFVAPDCREPRKYFEFEVAPNGEWLDLAIDFSMNERKTDWEYDSGMLAASRIEQDKVLSAMKIVWKAFGKTPKAGDIWRGNLFRAVGASGETRGYLAWQPTNTAKPNFHVPEVFGEFEFLK